MKHPMTRRVLAAVLVILAALAAVLAGAIVTGRIAVVITHGVSMNPVYYQGDLVVVAKADSYHIGQIAAYHVPGNKIVALHRIIAQNPDGGFVFKGDNNQSIDPYYPTADQLVGTAVLHVSHAGQWLQFLTNPIALGAVAFALTILGGTTIRTRRRKRRAAMARNATSGDPRRGPMLTMPHRCRLALAVAGVVGLLGLVLGLVAWTSSAEIVASTSAQSNRQMDFSYSATVPVSAAYDGTTVTSPDPVFRKLANTVDVQLRYHGDGGTMSVAAELSNPSGWHTTIPLADSAAVTADPYDTSVTLDLNALDLRAQAAAEATGLPAAPLTVAVVATVLPTGGGTFTPKLTMVLAPLALSLSGDSTNPTVKDSTTLADTSLVPNTMALGPWHLTVIAARIASVILLLAAMLVGAAAIVVARRTPPIGETAEILRRYAPMVASVEPIVTPANVIEVTEFATLAKLAQRCGQLVLHWSRSGVQTFVILDEGTTYRYRTGSAAPADPDESAPADLVGHESCEDESCDQLEHDRS